MRRELWRLADEGRVKICDVVVPLDDPDEKARAEAYLLDRLREMAPPSGQAAYLLMVNLDNVSW